MNRKFANVCLMVVLCLIISVFAGCAPSKTENAVSPPAEKAAAESSDDSGSGTGTSIAGQSLVIWEHTPQFEAPLKAVIDAFVEKNPGVKIEYQIKTSDQYYNLLATTIQAGEAPDLFWTNGTATTNLEAYVKQGVIMDITDIVDLSLFSDTTKEIVTIDGRCYASPTAEVGGRAVFYNKDIFEKLGIGVPATFSEFEAILAKIHSEGIIPISFSGSDPWPVHTSGNR
jgi:raffinose/stachyose/melibiose transport system substrate-binding protein